MKGLDKVFNEKNLKVVGQVAKRSCNVIGPGFSDGVIYIICRRSDGHDSL